MNNISHITLALEATRAERQQVVSIRRYSERRNRFPDHKGLLLTSLPSHALPKLAMRSPCKCQQHISHCCICCKIIHIRRLQNPLATTVTVVNQQDKSMTAWILCQCTLYMTISTHYCVKLKKIACLIFVVCQKN